MNRSAAMQRFYQNVANTIKEFGRTIISVPGSRTEPTFTYTIGNHSSDFPELLIIGGRSNDIADVLNELSQQALDNEKPFSDGDLVSLGGEHPVKIIDACDPEAKVKYTVQAGQFYLTEDYRLQQVLIPDKTGKFPPDCDKRYQVPLFGGIIH